MDKKGIKTARDFEDFFEAYNQRDWDRLFSYLTDDCIWDAAEKRCHGRQETQQYWTEYHASINEMLGKPVNVVFGKGMAYLEVPIRMEFLKEGSFFGKSYPQGSVLDFWCADAYTLDAHGTIKQCRVYSKFD